MSDTRKIIPALKESLEDIWGDVVLPSFDSEHSAAKWLTQPNAIFNGVKPIDLLLSNDNKQERVFAVLEKFDDIRLG